MKNKTEPKLHTFPPAYCSPVFRVWPPLLIRESPISSKTLRPYTKTSNSITENKIKSAK